MSVLLISAWVSLFLLIFPFCALITCPQKPTNHSQKLKSGSKSKAKSSEDKKQSASASKSSSSTKSPKAKYISSKKSPSKPAPEPSVTQKDLSDITQNGCEKNPRLQSYTGLLPVGCSNYGALPHLEIVPPPILLSEYLEVGRRREGVKLCPSCVLLCCLSGC